MQPLEILTPKYLVNNIAHQKQLTKLKEIVGERERINWAGELLELPEVWLSSEGENVNVAVLDTGVDLHHPDLEDAIDSHVDFTGDGIMDVNGHGTHCAGIIGARQNDKGFVGVAPKCRLHIAKVLGNNGGGAYSWIENGVIWAMRKGVDIISMSLGGPISTDGLHKAIHMALAEGISIFVAAGNDGSIFSNTIGYPGRYGGVITVASHDSNGNRSGFSSKGGEIDFMAPGSEIWSTYKNGSYASLSGTSMACPFVAGLGALILSRHKKRGLSASQIENNEDMRNRLLLMAAHPGYHDNVSGYGPLQPFKYFSKPV